MQVDVADREAIIRAKARKNTHLLRELEQEGVTVEEYARERAAVARPPPPGGQGNSKRPAVNGHANTNPGPASDYLSMPALIEKLLRETNMSLTRDQVFQRAKKDGLLDPALSNPARAISNAADRLVRSGKLIQSSRKPRLLSIPNVMTVRS